MWDEVDEMRSRKLFGGALVTGLYALVEQPDPDRAQDLGEFAKTVPAGIARHIEALAYAQMVGDPGQIVRVAEQAADAKLTLLAVHAYSTAIETLRADGLTARAAEVHDSARRRLSAFGPDAVTLVAPSARVNTRPVLTGRELEVARLVAEGYSNSSVAGRLGISVRTVENHLHRAFGKLSVTNRTDLIRVLGSLRT
jgi:DNA-binding CsgD family transcriptional regulator